MIAGSGVLTWRVAVMVMRLVRPVRHGGARRYRALTIVLQTDEITPRQHELGHEQSGDETGHTAIQHECSLGPALPVGQLA